MYKRQDIYRAAGLCGMDSDRHSPGIIVRGDGEAVDIVFRHPLEPDGLPDEDIFPDNAYEAALYAEVLKEKDLNGVKDELEAIKPMPAAFDHAVCISEVPVPQTDTGR